MLIRVIATLCFLRAATAVIVRSPQATSSPSINFTPAFNVTATNDTSSASNNTTPIKIAWNLGSSPSTADLRLLQTVSYSTAPVSQLLTQVIVGPLVFGNASTVSNLDPTDILLISCDDDTYNSSTFSVKELWTNAINQNVAAVIFVSQGSASCSPSANISSHSPYIYTMEMAIDSQDLVNASMTATAHNLSMPIRGVIAPASTFAVNGSMNAYLTGKVRNTTPPGIAAAPAENSTSDNNDSGSPSTAVAMIILYSITGVITALFLLVIITGAIRAHRHPERYGPSGNSAQGGRQSRAKGLARAMLETLPIVKFTAPDPAAKSEDVEMNATEPVPGSSGHGASTTAPLEGDVEKDQHTLRPSSRGSVHRGAAGSVRSGIGPAAPTTTTIDTAGAAAAAAAEASAPTTSPRPNTAATDDNPGCSICTDDFEPGQDLRLLPCGHRFHPACVDPWLLNVSGSCPLCRIDLNQDSKKKRTSASGTPATATADDDDEQPQRSDSLGAVTSPETTTGGALDRTRRLSRLALARFVQTAPLTGRRRARPRSGPITNGQYAQANMASPLGDRSPVPDAATPGAQDTPTSPSSNNRHSR